MPDSQPSIPPAARTSWPRRLWREWILGAALPIWVVITFGFTFARVDGESMNPTLRSGDVALLLKYPRWLRAWGLWEGYPRRGDIVVFRPPGEPHTDFIKRLIGLPGDRIQMKEGLLYINDVPVKKTYVDDWLDEEKHPPRMVQRYSETLPEGRTFQTLYETPMGPVENTDVYTVPPEHYFMMGDNRDNSRDSRYADPVGFVPAENLVGRADIIFFSWESLFSFRSGRFLKRLD